MKQKLIVKMMYAVALVMIMLVVLPSYSVEAKEEVTSYVVIGDSIGTGYGLGNAQTEGYASRVGNQVEAENITNIAVDGLNSAQLLAALQMATEGTAHYNIIQSADIITLTVGSNDLLGPFIEIVSDVFECEVSPLSEYKKGKPETFPAVEGVDPINLKNTVNGINNYHKIYREKNTSLLILLPEF